MPNISDTAYPRLKPNPSAKELENIFTPSPEERQFTWDRTADDTQTLRLLVWLKVFQRLGYFPSVDEISCRIYEHIAGSIGAVHFPEKLFAYSQSTQKWTHHAFVRDYLGVTAYGEDARKTAVAASLDAASTRDDLVDIVNVAIEELVRQRYELPAFSSFVKIARAARTRIINRFGNYELKTSQEITTLEPAMSITFLDDVMTPAGFCRVRGHTSP